MLYRLIKPFAVLIIKICFKKIYINNRNLLSNNGPFLLASNHPNSFLDAILLCILFKKPVYALTRGDAFKKKWAAKILHALHMLPVYREREGTENLHHNYKTFDKCLKILEQGGIILIFSEAFCVNEWHLRPIKKGTARLAAMAWEKNIPLQILPVGLNYSNFYKTGKIVHINFGSAIDQKNIINDPLEKGKLLNKITENIQQQLNKLVYKIDNGDTALLKKHFIQDAYFTKKILLFFPAIIGFVLHSPVYYPLAKFIYYKTKKTGHSDSIITALFFLTYPFFIALYTVVAYSLLNNWYGLLCIIILPFCAWCYTQFINPV
ncbi:MAG: 1-acyl-sn-glycerol-3-phosphate acyltransferase [Chitinophagaceae bacterium]|nr:1-acyl-sn-glycerol-3-phosphate acyltransferase [Chitinophagaceae bacterium]